MKEIQLKSGGRYLRIEDLKHMQEHILAATEILKMPGRDYVISGCEITERTRTPDGEEIVFSVEEGYAFISGKIRHVEAVREISCHKSDNDQLCIVTEDVTTGNDILYFDMTEGQEFYEYKGKVALLSDAGDAGCVRLQGAVNYERVIEQKFEDAESCFIGSKAILRRGGLFEDGAVVGWSGGSTELSKDSVKTTDVIADMIRDNNGGSVATALLTAALLKREWQTGEMVDKGNLWHLTSYLLSLSNVNARWIADNKENVKRLAEFLTVLCGLFGEGTQKIMDGDYIIHYLNYAQNEKIKLERIEMTSEILIEMLRGKTVRFGGSDTYLQVNSDGSGSIGNALRWSKNGDLLHVGFTEIFSNAPYNASITDDLEPGENRMYSGWSTVSYNKQITKTLYYKEYNLGSVTENLTLGKDMMFTMLVKPQLDPGCGFHFKLDGYELERNIMSDSEREVRLPPLVQERTVSEMLADEDFIARYGEPEIEQHEGSGKCLLYPKLNMQNLIATETYRRKLLSTILSDGNIITKGSMNVSFERAYTGGGKIVVSVTREGDSSTDYSLTYVILTSDVSGSKKDVQMIAITGGQQELSSVEYEVKASEFNGIRFVATNNDNAKDVKLRVDVTYKHWQSIDEADTPILKKATSIHLSPYPFSYLMMGSLLPKNGETGSEIIDRVVADPSLINQYMGGHTRLRHVDQNSDTSYETSGGDEIFPKTDNYHDFAAPRFSDKVYFWAFGDTIQTMSYFFTDESVEDLPVTSYASWEDLVAKQRARNPNFKAAVIRDTNAVGIGPMGAKSKIYMITGTDEKIGIQQSNMWIVDSVH